jgi:hypothetical protein
MKYKIILEKHDLETDLKLCLFSYGEWIEENDCTVLLYKNYHGIVLRGTSGQLNGYVVCKKNQMIFDDVDVHGGITYQEMGLIFDANYLIPEISKKLVIGFDCAHEKDLTPRSLVTEKETEKEMEKNFSIWKEINIKYKKIIPRRSPKTYKNMKFVIDEVCKLIDQVSQIEAQI